MSSTPCAACKCRRQKCTQECVFAPYFPPNDPHKFETVHKVFGASNVAKILHELPPQHRHDAVSSLVYEAQCRIQDPIYGCIGYISFLQHKLAHLRANLELAKNEVGTYMRYAQQQNNDFVADFNHKITIHPSFSYEQNETSHQLRTHAHLHDSSNHQQRSENELKSHGSLLRKHASQYNPPQMSENELRPHGPLILNPQYYRGSLLREQVQSNPK